MKEDKKIIQQFELVLPIQENKNEKKKLIKNIIYIIAITIIYSAIVIIIISLSTNDRNDEEKNDKETETKDSWDISYKKAEEFINKLNLTEQINLLFGTQNMKGKLVKNETEKGFLCNGQIDPFKNKNIDFKGMCLQDGPAGVRFAKGTSISWQASLNTAATFNKQLMYEIGKAQGQENKIKGINTILGPSANMFRSPQGGRVWESFGEDPFLTGVCASEIIKGIQNEGVIATMKHFVGNEQETYRKASSSNMDLSVLMDIYVEPFYRAIHDANLGAIMVAYNAINNTYCVENKYLLTDILRNIVGFKGFVMSDCWGV